MTINSTIRKAGPFIGNGSTTVFPFAFKVFTASDLLVVKLTVSTNVETTLVLTTDYTVTLNSDQDSNPGGSITLVAGALATGYTLTMTSDVANLQPTDLTNQGGFYPDVINNSLDRSTIQVQQLQEIADRSLQLPLSSTASTVMPNPDANQLIGWNSTASGLTNIDPATLASIVAYATAYADTFTGDGTTVNWVLTQNPGVLFNLDVSINGVTQVPTTDYTFTGTTFTTTTAAPLGAVILVKYREALPNFSGDAQDIRYVPAGAGAVDTDVQTKLRESVSVKDFGAVGDDTTDNLLFFKAALQHLAAQGGGALYVPSGVYRVSSPIIVTSNIELFGDGISSQIKNSVGSYTNAGDVIHIGVSSEWVGWSNIGSAVTDATIANFDAGDYSKINASNVHIHDLHVATSATAGTQGLGIWVVNAQNFLIENIWSTNTATPVNVANDSAIAQMACRNGVVRNVIQVTAGRWYDLIFIGCAEFIDVSGCMNNPTSNSTLNAAITVGGLGRFNRIHDNQILFQSVGSKVGIELTGPASATSQENYIYDNTIVKAGFGIVVYQMNNQSVYNNDFYSCTVGIKNYTTGTVFDSNTFFACTDDFDFKSGSSCTVTNSALSFAKLTGDTTALVAQQTYRNCWGFGGIKQRVYWGTDYVISAPDLANVTIQNAFVQFAAGKTTELYFRLPDNLYELQELLTYWYAGAAGEVLTQKLYKRESFVNINTWVQVGSTQTYTSGGVGDQTATWTGIGAVVTNVQGFQPDQYYVELQVVNANANTQLRGSQATYNTTGTLD